MIRKLKSQKGESIGEVLVAMLVVSLGSILFASMVTASQRLVTRSQKAYKSYVTARSQLENESGSTISSEPSTVSLKPDPTSTNSICGINEQAKADVKVYINNDEKDGVTKKFIYKPESDATSPSNEGGGS